MWITYLLLILLAVSITALALWISLKPTRNEHIGNDTTKTTSPPPVLPTTPPVVPAIPPLAASPHLLPGTPPRARPETTAPGAPLRRNIETVNGNNEGSVDSPSDPFNLLGPSAASTPNLREQGDAKHGSRIHFDLDPTATLTSGV